MLPAHRRCAGVSPAAAATGAMAAPWPTIKSCPLRSIAARFGGLLLAFFGFRSSLSSRQALARRAALRSRSLCVPVPGLQPAVACQTALEKGRASCSF